MTAIKQKECTNKRQTLLYTRAYFDLNEEESKAIYTNLVVKILWSVSDTIIYSLVYIYTVCKEIMKAYKTSGNYAQ